VAHLAHDLDEAGNEIGALDVLMGLVEDDELIERVLHAGSVAVLRVREELEEAPVSTPFNVIVPKPADRRLKRPH
jgi:hypothetical protein